MSKGKISANLFKKSVKSESGSFKKNSGFLSQDLNKDKTNATKRIISNTFKVKFNIFFKTIHLS